MNEINPIRDYFDRRFGQEDSVLHTIRSQSAQRGLPPIQVPIHFGRLLYLLAKIQGAQRILEIGTLGGYSAVWLARALPPGGKLVALEINSEYVELAKEHIQLADLSDSIEIRQGNGVDLLAELASQKVAPFDFIFIDANKNENPLYLEWALHLSRPGTLILIDNVIPKGNRVGYPSHHEAEEVYAFNDYIAMHPSLELAIFPTLAGESGRVDGAILARVRTCLKSSIG